MRGAYREMGGVDGGVDVDDLLQQGGYRAERVPQHWGEVGHHLTLLAARQDDTASVSMNMYIVFDNNAKYKA